MLSTRGKELLFADADGATTFEEIKKLQKSLSELTEGLHYCFKLCSITVNLMDNY